MLHIHSFLTSALDGAGDDFVVWATLLPCNMWPLPFGLEAEWTKEPM